MEILPLSYGERGGKVKRRGACVARFQATIARDRAMELRVQPNARSAFLLKSFLVEIFYQTYFLPPLII